MSDDIVTRVKRRYRALEPYDLQVIDSRSRGISNGRRVEFYPPDERDNPIPGKPTVELFDPSFQGEAAEDIIAADALHYLAKKDQPLIKLRNEFKNSITPEQMEVDVRAYRRAQSDGDRRTFNEWYETHRLDQYLGVGFLPKGSRNRQEWEGALTPQQKRILRDIEGYMKTGGKKPLIAAP